MSDDRTDLIAAALECQIDPGYERRKRAADRRRQRNQSKPRKLASSPKIVPTRTNTPQDASECPRCGNLTDGFRWMSRERTWRCCRCRVPVRFRNGLGFTNLDRDCFDDLEPTWRLQNLPDNLPQCVELLAACVASGTAPVVKTRETLRNAGHHRKDINRALRLLRLRERQLTRPGPMFFVVQESMSRTIADILAGLIDRVLAREPPEENAT